MMSQAQPLHARQVVPAKKTRPPDSVGSAVGVHTIAAPPTFPTGGAFFSAARAPNTSDTDRPPGAPPFLVIWMPFMAVTTEGELRTRDSCFSHSTSAVGRTSFLRSMVMAVSNMDRFFSYFSLNLAAKGFTMASCRSRSCLAYTMALATTLVLLLMLSVMAFMASTSSGARPSSSSSSSALHTSRMFITTLVDASMRKGMEKVITSRKLGR
mmetsp:Transcript_28745/g.72289  ORF Transcript_28745/g.72289 Transcript_28745/m.72289 type:complete len:211 (-) Transcript_28745:1873-2505(-)